MADKIGGTPAESPPVQNAEPPAPPLVGAGAGAPSESVA